MIGVILIDLFVFLGILIGSLTAELGGIVNIRCEKTGYNAEIEFKLKVSDFRFLLLSFFD